MGANTIINLLKPNKILMVAEGLNIFKMQVVQTLEGQSLAGSQIRKETGCSVIAIRRDNKLKISPDPSLLLENGDEMVLIGTSDAEKRLLTIYS
jgi:K+/H+ antiporter YhaU regulatory subunit KhtT